MMEPDKADKGCAVGQMATEGGSYLPKVTEDGWGRAGDLNQTLRTARVFS